MGTSLDLRTPESFRAHLFSSLRLWLLGQRYKKPKAWGPALLPADKQADGTECLPSRGQLPKGLEEAQRHTLTDTSFPNPVTMPTEHNSLFLHPTDCSGLSLHHVAQSPFLEPKFSCEWGAEEECSSGLGCWEVRQELEGRGSTPGHSRALMSS